MSHNHFDSAIVIGAGIAGAAVARQLAERGIAVTVLERAEPASGGSGNPVAVVRAEPGSKQNPIAVLTTAAMRWLQDWIMQNGKAVPRDFCGAYRMTRDAQRHQKLARHIKDMPHDWLQEVDKEEAGSVCGQAVADPGFLLAAAGWLEPAALIDAMLSHPLITVKLQTGAQQLEQASDGEWQVTHACGLLKSRLVVIASAFAGALSPVPLQLDRARGQLSCLPERAGKTLHKIICRDGYVTPAVRGMHTIGATMQYDDDCSTARASDDAENFLRLQRLLPNFAENASELQSGRVAFRATTKDHLPLVGRITDGLYCSLGHGARGITCAPLCGEWLAAMMVGETVPSEWRRWLDPLRANVPGKTIKVTGSRPAPG